MGHSLHRQGPRVENGPFRGFRGRVAVDGASGHLTKLRGPRWHRSWAAPWGSLAVGACGGAHVASTWGRGPGSRQILGSHREGLRTLATPWASWLQDGASFAHQEQAEARPQADPTAPKAAAWPAPPRPHLPFSPCRSAPPPGCLFPRGGPFCPGLLPSPLSVCCARRLGLRLLCPQPSAVPLRAPFSLPAPPAAGRRPSARPLPVPARPPSPASAPLWLRPSRHPPLAPASPWRRARPRLRGPVSLHPSRPAPGRARAPPPPVPHCRTAGAQCIAPAPSIGGPPPAEIKPPAPAPPVPLAETSARGKDAWPRGPPPRPPAFRSGSPPRGQVLDAERSWGPAPGEAALLAAGIRRPPRAPGPALGSVPAGGEEEGGGPAALVYEAAAAAPGLRGSGRRLLAVTLGPPRAPRGWGRVFSAGGWWGSGRWGCPGDGVRRGGGRETWGPSTSRPHPMASSRRWHPRV